MCPFFSIIIPFHNNQRYLDACLQSVSVQNFKNFEVILVENNSVDRSEQICQPYLKKYANFNYYQQKRAGVSAARNLGIAKATGKYVLFVDADDFLEPVALESLYNLVRAESYEIVYFNMNNVGSLGTFLNRLVSPFNQEKLLNQNEAFQSLILEQGYRGFVWNKLYLRSQISTIKFNENIQFLEDMLFNIETITKCDNIYSFPAPLTNYRIHKDSFVNKQFNIKQLSYLDALDIAKTEVPIEFIDDLNVLKRLGQIKLLSQTLFFRQALFKKLRQRFKETTGNYTTRWISVTKFQINLISVANTSLTLAALILKIRTWLSKQYHFFKMVFK